jgi:hypothetical protein
MDRRRFAEHGGAERRGAEEVGLRFDGRRARSVRQIDEGADRAQRVGESMILPVVQIASRTTSVAVTRSFSTAVSAMPRRSGKMPLRRC